MSAPLGPPPAGGDRDRGPGLVALFWTECALAMIIVGLRFYARISIRNLGADDWMMLFTVLLFLIMTCFVTYLASIGGCRHLYYLTPEQALQALKWSWISEPWGVQLFTTGKASVAILIIRIMGRTSLWRKWFLYAMIISVFIVNSLGCIFIFVQCDPPRALWTPSLPGHCWNPNVQEHFTFFLAAWNMFTDVVLALFPITIFWNLKMKLSRRIAICCLLGLGLVAALFSAIRYRYIVDLTARSDFTWGSYNIEAWSGAEGFVMIVCGNIPPLKPLWDRFVAGKLDSNYGHVPINFNMEKYHSKLSSTAKTSSSGDTTRILPIQHGAWSQNCSQTEAGSKAYTEINAIESANEV